MHGTAGIPDNSVDDDQPMDPSSAATLLDKTEREARDEFTMRSPLIDLARAVVFIVGYGAIALSTRNQHPYSGPKGTGLAVLLLCVLGLVGTAILVAGPKVSGIGGRAQVRAKAVGVIFIVTIAAVFVFEAALQHHGVSRGLVKGTWIACGPMLMLGPLAAVYGLQDENWSMVVAGMFMTAVGAAAGFAAPWASWGIVGLGCGIVFLARAGFGAWQHQQQP
jgi:hypothetical protein